MTRVLYVHGGLLNTGGTESVMMNFYRNIDREKVHIDFLLHGFGKAVYDDEIISSGGKIFNVVPKGQNPVENTKQIREIIKNGNYDVVHSHMDAGNAQILKIAKELNVPLRISHSHNTATQTSNPLKKVFNEFEKKKIYKYATHLFACSDLAGKWLYGDKAFTVINNAIDVQRFEYSPELRNEMRKRLGISEDNVVLGHIGRFSYQKNHEKLITVFNSYLKKHSDAFLIMIGAGETKESIKKAVEDLKIEKNVLFVEPNNETNKYMQAMDCFVMPSRFEGLPVVTVEAQAAALPIVISDTVSKKCELTDLVSFVPLAADDDDWCSAIDEALKIKRYSRLEELGQAGYDIKDSAVKMQRFYMTGELLF